ncbi:MAG: PLP-dependent aminotransferase family protein [Lachnospiraceae bacterium]|nr:PLP-dependent aminotransferase family protein [Lachnospiraceae bacterium]
MQKKEIRKEEGEMLTYTFEDRGDTPYYEYLYIRIKNDILNGNLSAGEKLPSKRAFAAQLSLSVMTIENAYAQLMVEGYIIAVERRGYFAADTSFLEKGFAGGASGDEQKKQIPKENRDKERMVIADFTSNSIRPENFPFSVWAKLMRRVLTESREELLLKPPAQGMWELRTAIAEHLRRFRGMEAKPEQVVAGAGTEYLYGLLIQLLGRGRIYGVENPGYRKISQIYRSNGIQYRTVEMDENGIDVGALRKSGADVIHISPSHHFPTGIVTPISRRAELLAWACERENRYIIEDDYDCEFRFTGRPIPTMAGIDRHDRVIYMNTFSRSLTPSIRISYMVLPESLTERFREQLGFYSCTVSNFEQMTLAAFLSEGYFEKHINRLRNYYREKRDYLIEELLDDFPKGTVRIEKEEAGLHFLLHLETKLSDAELKARALEEGIRVSCLSDYYEEQMPQEEGRIVQESGRGRLYRNREDGENGTLVINYSGIAADDIPKTAKKLRKIVH